MDRCRGRSDHACEADDTAYSRDRHAHDLVARATGVGSVRVATTHRSRHRRAAHHRGRDLGMDVSGFLMMSHMAAPDVRAPSEARGRSGSALF